MNRLVPALALALAAAGCGTHATAYLHRGGKVQGTIADATPEHLVLGTEDGRRVTVLRRDVEELRHPGIPAMVGGGLITVATVPVTVTTATTLECERGNDACEKARAAILIPSVALVGTGIGMIVWGLTTHEQSRARLKAASGDVPSGDVPSRAPPSAPAPQREWYPPF
ncbi:MAG: hypothetical protein IT377_27075 [Polyangiaceae bacterium]|nr:hypothetical protein [Polyangiaceae bacterium]